MIQLYPEQLSKHLNKKLHAVYLLLGNDLLLLQESCNMIYKVAYSQGFRERHVFQLDKNTNWQIIFSLCRMRGLFNKRQIIKLLLPEDNISVIVNEQLMNLISLLHDDLLLIINSSKINKIQKTTHWFIALSSVLVQVTCLTPKQENLPYWISKRAKSNNLQLEDAACQLLCYYYEGNLSSLVQILERCSLLWPCSKITLSHIEQIVNDVAYFTPFHWIDALLMAKCKRALHILQHLRLQNNDPAILLRILQHEVLLLVKFEYQIAHNKSLNIIFKKYKIWESRQAMLIKALKRFHKEQLQYIIYLLAQTEIILKRDYIQLIWTELERISLILCNKKFLDIFTNDQKKASSSSLWWYI